MNSVIGLSMYWFIFFPIKIAKIKQLRSSSTLLSYSVTVTYSMHVFCSLSFGNAWRMKDSYSLFLLSTLLLIKSLNCNCWHPTEQMSSVEEHWCQKRGELSPSISTCQSERAKEVDQSHRLRRKHSHTLSADSCYRCVQLLCRLHIILTLPACRLSSAYFWVNGTSLKHNVPGNVQKLHLQNISYRSLITHIGCQMV